MSDARFRTFGEFYPFYLSEHGNRMSRRLHFIGTSIALPLAVAAVATQIWWLLAVALVQGYAFAWVGHFFFEHNKPATFQHPLWSLRGDFRMYLMALRGKMADEVERVCGGDLPEGHTHETHLEQAQQQAGGVPHASHANGTARATA